jgi:ribosomal-protein-alanine N-acetyltransferase
MAELQRLRADHASAVLAFETANRTYFAASISDRGDAYFERFTERHDALLADQADGGGAYYVLVADDGAVLGRFNLIFAETGVAELGYRVAMTAAGNGVATAAVRELCSFVGPRHRITLLRAATSSGNVASQRVLQKAGFAEAGPADPSAVGGKVGTWWELAVVAPDATVRPAGPGDVAALRGIYRRASLSNEGDREALLGSPEVLDWQGANLARTRVAANAEGTVLGFATVVPIVGGLELEDLFVDPAVMRRGIATLLVRAALDEASREGAAWIKVTANPHAAAFYASVGFAHVRDDQTLFGPAPRLRVEINPAG